MNLGSWGLVLDVFGVILLWKFGLPESLNRGGVALLAGSDVNEEEKEKVEIYDHISRFALLLLVVGFGLQLIYSLQTQNAAKLNQEMILKSNTPCGQKEEQSEIIPKQ